MLLGLVLLLGLAQERGARAVEPQALSPAAAAQAAPAPPAAATSHPANAPPVAIEPPPADAAAEAHVQYANQLFLAGQFFDAAAALRRAYERTPKAIYLFNAGQSYRKGLHPVEALEMYERFVAAAPDHPLSGEARAHIQTIQVLLSQQRENEAIKLQLTGEQAASEEARRRAQEAQRKAEEASKQAELASQQAVQANQQAVQANQKAEAERRRTEEAQRQLALEKKANLPVYKRKAFWIVAGVAAVSVIAVGLAGGLLYDRINKSDQGTINYSPTK